MNRAAVLIGVNKVKGRNQSLPMLNDAVRGAQAMRKWVLDQGFDAALVKFFVDDNEPVVAPVVAAPVEEDEEEGEEADPSAVNSANLEELKCQAAEHFTLVRALFEKMIKALKKEGHKGENYLALHRQHKAVIAGGRHPAPAHGLIARAALEGSAGQLVFQLGQVHGPGRGQTIDLQILKPHSVTDR